MLWGLRDNIEQGKAWGPRGELNRRVGGSKEEVWLGAKWGKVKPPPPHLYAIDMYFTP